MLNRSWRRWLSWIRWNYDWRRARLPNRLGTSAWAVQLLHANEALRHSEHRFRDLFDEAPIASGCS